MKRHGTARTEIDWSGVVREHGAVVWGVCRRLTGAEQDAADCFQDTFLAAVELARREAVRHWPAVLRRIATARCLDHLRRRCREAGRLVRGGDGDVYASPSAGPRWAAESAELAERLRVALATLPGRQAEVFCLRFVEQMSYEQIAEATGLGSSNVGVLLHRARGRLRQMLTEDDAGREQARAAAADGCGSEDRR